MLLLEGGANLFVFGKTLGLQLGKDLGPVDQDFKPPVPERLELQVRNPLLEFFQDFLRQTDGVRFVLSGRAVLDGNLHRGPFRPALTGAVLPGTAARFCR